MGKVIESPILFDPLFRELMNGLEEIVQEAPKYGLEDVAVEIRKTRNEIKKEVVKYSMKN